MNRRSTSTALTLLSLIFAVSISSRARSAQVGELEKLNVCYSSIAATSITTWVPHEAGFYKKYGLDVSIIYVAGAQAIATLVSGDTQIVQGSGAAAALSRRTGADEAEPDEARRRRVAADQRSEARTEENDEGLARMGQPLA